MPNMRIITSKLIDAATVTSSPVGQANLLAANLQNPKRASVFRSTSTADQNILVNLSDVTSINAVVLYNHNMQTGATWRVLMYSGANQTGTTLYDSGATDVFNVKSLGALNWGIDPLAPHIFNDWENKNQFCSLYQDIVDGVQSLKITLSDAANTNGYLEAGRLYIGMALESSINPLWGDVTVSWLDQSTQYRTDGGSLRTDIAQFFRSLSVSLSKIANTERAKFMELARWAGKRKDLFVSVFPTEGSEEERDYAMAAKFTNDMAQTPASWGVYSMQFELEEI